MGIYLNPGNENFKEMSSMELYVDKTIAGNMLSSYYSKGCDSRELFAKFKIASDPGFEEKLNKKM